MTKAYSTVSKQPFIGDKMMKQELGEAYVDTVRKTIQDGPRKARTSSSISFRSPTTFKPLQRR